MKNEFLTWKNFLSKEKNKEYFIKIFNFINFQKTCGKKIFPEKKDIFKSIKLTPLKNIKIVIIGQDPYYKEDQADGLCFSVKKNSKIPPSLRNIFKELKNSIKNFIIPKHGCLNKWAIQGVLLLNTVLTVEENRPNSHINIGWQKFTDKIIEIINFNCYKVIFILWGYHAKKKSY
ncbi:ung [Wigglesworthia glossinidia endosymbiont of Glossina brevipalpis]|uniref:Uracil-DNA glycosylase n=1 Tax=Wigglesworthia glossinidia brevipalpis TaxID=36870 RepID=Q8D2S1_WIGBR|nr:ung [Wigglesworthia glossinidia endosymbiont of Glossina brevipalpis]